jgi:hypothetical protein
MRATAGTEGGQATPLVATGLLVALLGCLLVAQIGRRANLEARVRTAADGAALAGAAAGPAAAGDAARANGATVISSSARHGVFEVTVALVEAPDVRATASAAGTSGPPGEGDFPLAPALRAALHRAGDLLGHPVPIVGAVGSDQVLVPAAAALEVATVSRFSGLCIVPPGVDPVHFGVCPPRTSRL